MYRLKQLNISLTEMPVELKQRTVGKSSVAALAFLAAFKELATFLWSERR